MDALRKALDAAAEETLDPDDWTEVRTLSHQIVDDAVGYLREVRDRPVWQDMPADVRTFFAAPLPRHPAPLSEIYREVAENVMTYPMGNVHPRFWAWYLDLAGRVILDRVIGAVVALVHLFRFRTDSEREHLVTEADTNIGRSAFNKSLMTGTAYCPVAAGSPGPFDRKTPSGFNLDVGGNRLWRAGGGAVPRTWWRKCSPWAPALSEADEAKVTAARVGFPFHGGPRRRRRSPAGSAA